MLLGVSLFSLWCLCSDSSLGSANDEVLNLDGPSFWSRLWPFLHVTSYSLRVLQESQVSSPIKFCQCLRLEDRRDEC